MAPRGLPLVISAPSGAGKTTLIRRLCEQEPGLEFSISHTTRPPRDGESDGVEYHFVDEAAFRAMAAAGGFAEWALVHGNLYGTSFAALEEQLARGSDVILDIDVQGALQVSQRFPEAVLIFIQPPSLEELHRRLEARGSDSPEVIERRLRNAAEEMSQAHRYHHVVVNERLERAAAELAAVVAMVRGATTQPSSRAATAATD
ncbi:MAG: guanylate kinase [Deferrisomatales bacterium]|nr:guanylate kinase [Deferrisomatales bacterium]